jgi:hypothetical protein
MILACAGILQKKTLMMHRRARNPRLVTIMDVYEDDGAAGVDD